MAPLTNQQAERLMETARRLRVESLRMIARRGAGHPGGALSAAEILAVLYFHFLRIDPANPGGVGRDRFVLSKGHASAALYTALALRGFFPIAELDRWGEVDCPHQGHPDRLKTPGVDMTSGLLGHGLAIGAGLALAARLRGADYRTVVLLGDGECQAGVVWEGAAVAAKYGLANLIGIVDNNGVQLDGPVREVMPIEPLGPRWAAWGWRVVEVDGHDVRQVAEGLDAAAASRDRPTMIVAHTIKGRGVSFMENEAAWHGGVPTPEQLGRALAELGQGARDG
jgi:transketolase